MTNLILLVIVLIAIVLAVWWSKKEEYGGGFYATPNNYKTLATQYDNPLFSPCISKRCAGGPYMFTNNPYLQTACQNVNCLGCQQCIEKGYYGKPVHFKYSSLSDGCWGNSLCNTLTPSSLCVL